MAAVVGAIGPQSRQPELKEQPNAPRRSPMIGNRMCTLALTAASVIICSTPPANAAGYDGSWSMVAETTRGHCGTIAVGFGVNRGRIHSTSGSFAFYPIR